MPTITGNNCKLSHRATSNKINGQSKQLEQLYINSSGGRGLPIVFRCTSKDENSEETEEKMKKRCSYFNTMFNHLCMVSSYFTYM